ELASRRTSKRSSPSRRRRKTIHASSGLGWSSWENRPSPRRTASIGCQRKRSGRIAGTTRSSARHTFSPFRIGPAALSHLNPITVGILEPRDPPKRELDDVGWVELHAARHQRLEDAAAVFHLERHLHRSGCHWRENEFEILTFDTNAQKSSSAGRRHVPPLLETDDIRIEIERVILVAHEHGYVRDVFQHCPALHSCWRFMSPSRSLSALALVAKAPRRCPLVTPGWFGSSYC